MARILVIEDHTASLDLMIYLLSSFGHTAFAARDGEEGLQTARSVRPHLILCDVQLPKLSGYEVVQNVKAHPTLQLIPVIALTAFAMVGDRERILQAGFDDYLAKPIDPELFAQQIQPYLGRHLSAATVSSLVEAAVPPPDSKAVTILAVDNVPANLSLVRSLLEPFGYRVITVSGGHEALFEANLERPHLILSDVCMMDGNGYEFIRKIKATPHLSSVPFILITSSMTGDQDRARGLALGAARFLVRPIDSEKLLAEIEACLSERRSCG